MLRLERHVLAKFATMFRQGRYSTLLMSLLLLPMLQAAIDGYPVFELVYFLAFVGMIAAATAAACRGRHVFWTTALFGVPAIISVLSVPILGMNPDHLGVLVGLRTGVCLLLLGFLCLMILEDVGRSRRVMFDQVCGGLCVYLMIGFAWGMMYAAIERMSVGSFTVDLEGFGLTDLVTPMRLNSVMTYFSFATLTTLGYGDISPLSPLARGLVWIEAVLGQIYMAVFVAKLVSQYLADATMTITVGQGPTRPGETGPEGDESQPQPLPNRSDAART